MLQSKSHDLSSDEYLLQSTNVIQLPQIGINLAVYRFNYKFQCLFQSKTARI